MVRSVWPNLKIEAIVGEYGTIRPVMAVNSNQAPREYATRFLALTIQSALEPTLISGLDLNLPRRNNNSYGLLTTPINLRFSNYRYPGGVGGVCHAC
ncbi:hypothetical protein BSY18_1716 [Blastomonas sp. RAC04]|nr:hypothetical protein BSY18_1716 [Blastomonas sp. RAC04]